MNQQYVHLIIVLIIIGSSVIRVVYNKLREQAAKRRAQQDLERRRMEALRTGRDTDTDRSRTPATAAAQASGANLEDLAKKRAAQLAELRRMQQARHRGGTPPPRPASAGEVVLRVPGSSGTTVPSSRPGPMPVPTGPTARSTRRPAPLSRPAPQDSRRQTKKQQQQSSQSPPAPRSQPQRRPVVTPPADEIAPARASIAAREPSSPQTSRQPLLTHAATADWRRAILMSEILAAPLSIRSGETGPTARRF